MLSSNASAAENQGDRLGEFLRVGVYEGREFYKQRDTLGRTNTYLYSEGDKWVVREDLPEKKPFLFGIVQVPTPDPPYTQFGQVFHFLKRCRINLGRPYCTPNFGNFSPVDEAPF